jgi:protein-S-isoprenylcysteine O-methyltransferase Ste14
VQKVIWQSVVRFTWPLLRWILVGLVLGWCVWIFLQTVRHVPGPESGSLPFWFWYGNWRGVLRVTGIFSLFVLGFTLPRKKIEWRNAGLYTAFFISLFAEMFGLPLTIFILAPLLDLPPWIFGHTESHLWAFALNWFGLLPLYLGAYVVMVVSMGLLSLGLGLLAIGWATVYRDRGRLVTRGIYSLLRHPQYLGLILMILAFNIQWPTLPTLLLGPVLIITYIRQARREDRELDAVFGQEFRDYAIRVGPFLPFRRSAGPEAAPA